MPTAPAKTASSSDWSALDDAAGADALDLRQRHGREHAAEAPAGLAVAADRRHVRQPAGVDEIQLHARAGELEVEVMFFWNGMLSAKRRGRR